MCTYGTLQPRWLRLFLLLLLLLLPTGKETFSIHGFGYDQFNNDFKVVCVSAPRQRVYINLFQRCHQVGLYSLRSNSWKTMEMPNIFPKLVSDRYSSFPFGCSLVLNDSIHWLLCYCLKDGTRSFGIVAFDLRTELFKLINSPKGDVRKICELSGCLSLITDGPRVMEIWVMKKYGDSGSWTKHLSIESIDLNMYPDIFQLLFFLNNENVVTECSDSRNSMYCSLYDPRTNMLEYLRRPREGVIEFTTYVEIIFLS